MIHQMTKHLTILFILLSSLTSSLKGQNYNDLIIGKWTGTKKETKNGNGKLRDGRPNQNLHVFEFKKDNIVVDYTFTPEVKELNYTLSGPLLAVGKGGKFKIEKLTAKELVVIEFDPKDPTNPLVFRLYFAKSK